jgi:lysophospholipase L1-like esterase
MILQKYPNTKATFVNRGRSSETLSGLTELVHPGPRPVLFDRLAEDLATTKPTLVFACYGMNDGIYSPLAEERFKPYRDGVQKLLGELAKIGVPVILISPPIFDSINAVSILRDTGPFGYQTPYRNYDSVLTAYSHWLTGRNSSTQMAINIHDYIRTRALAEKLRDPTWKYSSDGIHPGDQGHQWMAEAIYAGLFNGVTRIAPTTPTAEKSVRTPWLQPFTGIESRKSEFSGRSEFDVLGVNCGGSMKAAGFRVQIELNGIDRTK